MFILLSILRKSISYKSYLNDELGSILCEHLIMTSILKCQMGTHCLFQYVSNWMTFIIQSCLKWSSYLLCPMIGERCNTHSDVHHTSLFEGTGFNSRPV